MEMRCSRVLTISSTWWKRISIRYSIGSCWPVTGAKPLAQSVMAAGEAQAPICKGGGKSISELVAMSIAELRKFFGNLHLDDYDAAVAKRLLTEINNRLNSYPMWDLTISLSTVSPRRFRVERASVSIWPHRWAAVWWAHFISR